MPGPKPGTVGGWAVILAVSTVATWCSLTSSPSPVLFGPPGGRDGLPPTVRRPRSVPERAFCRAGACSGHRILVMLLTGPMVGRLLSGPRSPGLTCPAAALEIEE